MFNPRLYVKQCITQNIGKVVSFKFAMCNGSSVTAKLVRDLGKGVVRVRMRRADNGKLFYQDLHESWLLNVRPSPLPL